MTQVMAAEIRTRFLIRCNQDTTLRHPSWDSRTRHPPRDTEVLFQTSPTPLVDSAVSKKIINDVLRCFARFRGAMPVFFPESFSDGQSGLALAVPDVDVRSSVDKELYCRRDSLRGGVHKHGAASGAQGIDIGTFFEK